MRLKSNLASLGDQGNFSLCQLADCSACRAVSFLVRSFVCPFPLNAPLPGLTFVFAFARTNLFRIAHLTNRYLVAEPEELAPDSLTCGVCRKEFPLAEIVRFIQHKVHSCNKENYRLSGQSGGRPSRGEGDAVSVESNGPAGAQSVCSRLPSISAPINARKLNNLAVSSSAAEVTDEEAAAAVDDSAKADGVDQPRSRTTADAESNTVNSGESFNQFGSRLRRQWT